MPDDIASISVAKEAIADRTKANIALYNDPKLAKEFSDAAQFEKGTIIKPSLMEAFDMAAKLGTFDRTKDKVIDIGCGPFLLGLPFLGKKIHIDGYDRAPNMANLAQDTLRNNANLNVNGTRIFDDFSQIKKTDYGFGMLNFVHQCCATRHDLVNLFKEANSLLKPGSHFVVFGTHPEFLHVDHAAYRFNVEQDKPLQDGDVYTGTIYGFASDKTFELTGDHFWSRGTIYDAAREAGFNFHGAVDVADKGSFVRDPSDDPAYLRMTFVKPRRPAGP
jgi:SAM-dependent methyltransferase